MEAEREEIWELGRLQRRLDAPSGCREASRAKAPLLIRLFGPLLEAKWSWKHDPKLVETRLRTNFMGIVILNDPIMFLDGFERFPLIKSDPFEVNFGSEMLSGLS